MSSAGRRSDLGWHVPDQGIQQKDPDRLSLYEQDFNLFIDERHLLMSPANLPTQTLFWQLAEPPHCMMWVLDGAASKTRDQQPVGSFCLLV